MNVTRKKKTMNITNKTITQQQMSHYAQRRQTRLEPRFEHPQRPYVHEDKLAEQTVTIEHKKFTIRLSENVRGRLLRITEEHLEREKFNTIIVPMTGVDEFLKALAVVCAVK